MQFAFDGSAPLYQQLAAQIEEMIFTGGFDEEAQIPSTTQLSQQLHINPATVLKGMNMLVDDLAKAFQWFIIASVTFICIMIKKWRKLRNNE